MCQLVCGVIGNVCTGLQHIHAVGFIIHTGDLCQFLNGFLVFFRRRGRTEKNRIGNDSGQHHACYGFFRNDAVQLVQTVDHGIDAAHRPEKHEDRAGRFQIAQTVMVHHFQNLGAFNAVSTLLGFVVVHEDDRLIRRYLFHIFRCFHTEIIQRIFRFLVRFSRPLGYGIHAELPLQIGIADGSCNAVRIRGFMSDNKNLTHSISPFLPAPSRRL